MLRAQDHGRATGGRNSATDTAWQIFRRLHHNWRHLNRAAVCRWLRRRHTKRLCSSEQRAPHEVRDHSPMQRRVALLTFTILVVMSLQMAVGAPTPKKRPLTPGPLPCGDLVGFQVLLDRQGFSPGQIDGLPGANFSHALAAMVSARGLPSGSPPNCATWRALTVGASEPAIATYTVTSGDLKGPFEKRI